MLQIKHICKEYKTGNLVQQALDGVDLNLRENEFVAILGPSGSGKTTLLNIIGGLDRYDSGDLIINGISTKKYKDRDWDSYRNHTIGFVFQSYNLIPHQSVLSNVELALTISGISKTERRKRAKQALEQVGLGEQCHKRPSQMSGGQMQRVAIARALVNDPDILLADEPTGALDSETSVQVMELLKEVAKERLVVMVTHNPELAETYATRIVNLKDGKIRSDSNPFQIEEKERKKPIHKNMGKSSMSFLTALSLSFNNLRTKKARTLLTSFAGSIGIIGIALIMALSNGVNAYIKSIEEDTLSEYPLQIQSTGLDFTSMMIGAEGAKEETTSGDVRVAHMITNMFSRVNSNDLESLKYFLDSGESGMDSYVNAIEYSYNVSPQIFRAEEDNLYQVNPDKSFAALGFGSASASNSLMSMFMSTDVFHQMPENTKLFQNQYDVKAGRWPNQYNECVVVLTSGGRISDFMLYTMGLRDSMELEEMIKQFIAEEAVDVPEDTRTYSYEEFLGITFKLVNGADYYEYDDTYHLWKDKSEDEDYMRDLVENGEDITIVGVVQPSENASATMLTVGIAYPEALTKHVIEQASQSPIVQAQLEQPGNNVFTGTAFGEEERNAFDLGSMFQINMEAFQNAFAFEQNMPSMEMSDLFSMNGNMVDLSEYLNLEDDMSNILDSFRLDDSTFDLTNMLDFQEMQLDMPELSGLNMEDLMGQLNLSISSEDMQKLTGTLLNGYGDYAKSHPEADYSKLNEHIVAYLQTPEAQQRLAVALQEILASNGNVSIDQEQLAALVSEVMAGYLEYTIKNHLTDPDKFNEYLMEYLQTPEAQQLISDGLSKILRIDGEITIAPEQFEALVNDLMIGYQEYAAAMSLPDPSKMGEYFLAYLQTPEAKQVLSSEIMKIMEANDMETQIANALQSYMQTILGTYTETMAQTLQNQIASIMQQAINQMSTTIESAMQQAMRQVGENLEKAMQQSMRQMGKNMQTQMQQAMGPMETSSNTQAINPDLFKNAIEMNLNEEELTELLMSLMSGEEASYDNNLKKFGYADRKKPSSINIYPIDFASKEHILAILEDYNSRMEAEGKSEKVINYTDIVGTLMSSVTDIVDTISYVLIAFVSISLIVSSIMIGVITYISVLERKKEIGILRAIGASKRNISQVFNAETFIIGFCAGILGIGITLLLLIPGNQLIHSLAGQTNINASLPIMYALVLILLSVVLTLLGGLIPSTKAAKNDPVTALRTE